jgi:hypothetical protein
MRSRAPEPQPRPFGFFGKARVLLAGLALLIAPGWYLGFVMLAQSLLPAQAMNPFLVLILPYAPFQDYGGVALVAASLAFAAPSAAATALAPAGLRSPTFGWRATAILELALALVLDAFVVVECLVSVYAWWVHGT